MIHVYLQVGDDNDVHKQAVVLQQRLASRKKLAYFDPRNVEESEDNIEASRELRDLLMQKGETVLTVTTDQQFVLEDFLRLLG